MADRIRRAEPGEAAALTALVLRSKASWGYPPELMARFAEDLVITAAEIRDDEVWLLERDERILGVHRVRLGEPAVLADLWLEPEAIGHGHGRRLWEHAIDVARRRGATALELDADPNAQAFYERMGAGVVGRTPSTRVAGRSLPRMRYQLS